MSLPRYLFEIGDVVHHLRYGYRGVVFERDWECGADEDWYESNQTQPDRDQPWYHVLVDGAQHTTYVAQSNLEKDKDPKPIRHPLLMRLFEGYAQGRYYRQSMN